MNQQNSKEGVVSIIEHALPVEPVEFNPQPVWLAVRRRRTARRIRAGGFVGAGLVAAVVVANGVQASAPPDAIMLPEASVSSVSPADSPEPEATPGEIPTWEASLLPFAERLLAAGPRFAEFGGVKYVAEPLRIIVYWKGDPPEEISSIADEAGAAGIDVVFDDIPWSPSELEAAMNALVDALSADGVAVSMAGVAPGFDGILLAGPALSTDPSAQEQARALAQNLIGEIPLTFVPGPVKTLDGVGQGG